MPSYKPVIALLRGLEVLRAVNRDELVTVKAIHQETGYNKATIVRMLETLIHAGYVRADKNAGGYRIAGRALQLSAGFVRYDKAAQVCGPILERFRLEVGWPSDFAIRDDDALIVVRTSRATGPLNFNRNPGFRAPILQTSLGRAYLAYCGEAERDEILARLTDVLPRAPSLARTTRILDEVRAKGLAWMDEAYSTREYKGTMFAIAVPVMIGGRILGALNLMFLRQMLSPEEASLRYAQPLRDAAAEIAQALTASEL